jgi:hypothetical protein
VQLRSGGRTLFVKALNEVTSSALGLEPVTAGFGRVGDSDVDTVGTVSDAFAQKDPQDRNFENCPAHVYFKAYN